MLDRFTTRLAAPAVAGLVVLAACSSGPVEQPKPMQRTYHFHTISGVSMGAMGTAFLAGGQQRYKRLDAIGAMGGPMDAAYFLGELERSQMGGFCPLEKLEGLLKTEGGGQKLNDPTALDCQPREPIAYEHKQDFNHWKYTTNGANFDRSEYLEIFYDLSLAMGNPLYYNPESPIFPAKELTRAKFNAALCDHPIVLDHFYNKEYNPKGEYPVITFCDGEEPIYYCDDAAKTPVDYCSGLTPQQFCQQKGAALKAAGKKPSENWDLYYAKKGEYDPCYKHTEPVSFALAVDLNRNGKRDYFEPLIANAHERWQDVGKDGCANDKEDGKGGCTASGQTGDPNGDDFDVEKNPLGTQGNWVREEGEPYEDFGLDGVDGTHDFGEGNGQYDDGPNRAHWLATDFRQAYLKMTEQERKSIDVYVDGGVRDVFNFGLSGDMLTSATRALEPNESKRYTDFAQIPREDGAPWTDGYDPLHANYSLMGRNVFIRYGSPNPTVEALRAGDGDHVGTADQILARFGTYIKWVSASWTPALGEPTPVHAAGRRSEETFFSESLKAPRNFGLALPPGYDDPANKDKRYPVLFLLHGYGMEAGGMSDLNVLFDSFMQSGDIREMIVVYPSGRCCYVKPDGTKDCREEDELGNPIEQKPGYVRECSTGNFFTNRQGFTAGDNTAYADSLYELMDYVDQHYRVLAPKTVDVPTQVILR